MAHTPFFAPPSTAVQLQAIDPQIPDVLARPEAQKEPLLQKLMMPVMMVMMIGMVSLVVVSSGGLANMNPMMLMMPMMMVPMMASMFLSRNGSADLGQQIRNWLLQLRESRKIIHRQGRAMFEAQRRYFPQPQVMWQLIGSDDDSRSVMWQISRDEEAGIQAENAGSGAAGVTYNPYMAARIGVGTVELEPAIIVPEQQIQENLEPVTLTFWRRFMRTQRYVPGMPIAYDLNKYPYYRVEGHREHVIGLTRAMLASMTFNHSPSELALVVVTDDPETSEWASVKWLPHCQHPDVPDDGDTRRMVYPDMAAMWAGIGDLVSGRQVFGQVNNREAIPRVLVLVDLPGTVELPEGLDRRGRAGVTTVMIGTGDFAEADAVATDESVLMLAPRADAPRRETASIMVSTPFDAEIAVADQMTAVQFDLYVRTLSNYRPLGWGSGNEKVSAAPEETRDVLAYLGSLGFDDAPLDEVDLQSRWAATEDDPHLRIPLGNKLDERGRKTPDLAEVDIAESARGGTGPSGAASGKTGAGKSFLLRGIVLTLMLLYSPNRVNLILMDFKGGQTFIGMDNLPHVQASISNLESEADLLARADLVIRGEILRREELMRKARVDNIDDYRRLRKKKPELGLPPMPSLLVIADEFREFITNNREYLKLFESVAQVGRALGMHLLLCSQFIDETIIGSVKPNLTYGISLRVDSASHSTAVIKSPAATELAMGDGSAYLYKDVPGPDGQELTKFKAFNVFQPYDPPKSATAEPGGRGTHRGGQSLRDALANADGSAVTLFTVTSNAERVDGALHLSEGGGGRPSPSTRDTAVMPAAPTSEDAVEAGDDRPSHRDVVLAKLASLQVEPPHRMWLPPLDAPLTVRDIGAGNVPADGALRLRFRIGELDDPIKHERRPFVIAPEGKGAHIRIIGARGMGCSTTVEAIVAASGMVYSPQQVSFYIIDAGAKLREIEAFPNVGAYTAARDQGMVDRIIGECLRVIALRENAFHDRSVASFDSYWESKKTQPVDGDPYGHMFLVIDGFPAFMGDDDVDKSREARLVMLAEKGASLGVHLIAAGGDAQNTSYKLTPKFGLWLHHHIQDVTNSPVAYRNHEQRSIAKSVPAQPGRVLELDTDLQARIMLPHTATVTPTEVRDGVFEWNYLHDWGAAVRAFGQELSARWPEATAPRIEPVPASLDPAGVWALHAAHVHQTGLVQAVPLGISAEDLTLVSLPDTSTGNASPHLIVAGDQQSGKTTTARWLMRFVLQTYAPGAAQVFIIDPALNLLTERDYLDRRQLLGGYSTDKTSHPQLLNQVKTIIEQRQPRDPSSLTAADIRNRSWWSGPEVFLIIDGAKDVMGSGFGGSMVDVLNEVIGARNDLGLHVFVTTAANNFLVYKESVFFQTLLSTNPHTLLLSGTAQGNVFGSYTTGNQIQFRKRRPGLGQLYSVELEHQPVIQVPNDSAWPEITDNGGGRH